MCIFSRKVSLKAVSHYHMRQKAQFATQDKGKALASRVRTASALINTTIGATSRRRSNRASKTAPLCFCALLFVLLIQARQGRWREERAMFKEPLLALRPSGVPYMNKAANARRKTSATCGANGARDIPSVFRPGSVLTPSMAS